MNTFNLTLDLSKSRNVNPIRIRQGDLNGTEISALIYDHGAPADLTGLTAQWVMELPDGEHYYRKAATVSGNTVTVTINEAQAASVTGRTTRAYFQLLQGGTVKASTGSVTVDVLPDALEGHTVPESYDNAIQDAIDNFNNAVEDMPATVEGVLEDHPEWTTTVQKGSIGYDKLASDLTNPLDRLMYRLSNMLTATPAEAEVVTVADAAQTPMAGLTLYGRSKQDGTPTPDAPVDIVSVGGNLAKNNATTRTINGVTFTVNADGTIAVRGTATANSQVNLATRGDSNAYLLPDGTYTLTGCPKGGSGGTYELALNTNPSGAVVAHDYGSGSTFTLADGAGMQGCGLYIMIRSGKTVDLTFEPMLTRGSTAYPYVPYDHAGLWARRTSDAGVQSVTPVPLDGHELRSLPDGTRDELTVDERGHAVLVQRVGSVDLGTLTWAYDSTNQYFTSISLTTRAPGFSALRCSEYAVATSPSTAALPDKQIVGGNGSVTLYVKDTAYTDAATFKAAVSGATLLYKLATPVTHDLGLVDPIQLVGPDLTAQPIPDTTMALTYERDLDVTLARLEAAIAAIA